MGHQSAFGQVVGPDVGIRDAPGPCGMVPCAADVDKKIWRKPKKKLLLSRRDGRVVDCGGLENR